MRGTLLLVALAACGGDDGLPAAPDMLSAGPVTIDTRTLTLSIGSLTIDKPFAVAATGEIDEQHYYDPRGDAQAELVTLDRVLGQRDGKVVLAGGTTLTLTECAIPNCAVLELDASAHANAVQLQLALPRDPTEPLYGTGDAAVSANVAGAVREMQLRVDTESESSLNETHTPVPLVLWPRRGIGLFAADDRPGALDLGKTTADRVTATFTLPVRGTYRFYLYTAPTPLDLVRTYVALTTKPAVPPRWAFAPQQWRNAWNSSAEMLGDADAMRSRHIPGSVMWIDNPWETAYNTFVIDETRFTQPQQLVADLRARGFNVLFWSTPYIGTTPETAADHAEGAANDFFVTDDAGTVLDYPWQNGPGAMVDFTRPSATQWWQDRIKRVVDVGANGFKLDFGEEVVPDIGGTIVSMVLSTGDNSQLFRRYQESYHAAYLGALPPGDGFLITRAGAWGEQHVNTTIWPGDLDADFTAFGVDNGEGQTNVGGLPTAISRGLSLSVSGYPFYGSDIGGFRGFPTTEALLRWAEYASLGTIMQLGGGGQSHDPWDTTLFDPGADATYKVYADLHMQLHPLLWTLAQQAGADGTPVTRPARFMYDCNCDDAMFLLGDDILVAPVIVEGATSREVVLPEGQWRDADTGAVMTGDGHTAQTVPAPLGTLPRWQRVPSFVPMYARAADTLLPATAAGVTSYADPALGRELRVVYAPGPFQSVAFPITTALHDGAIAKAITETNLEVTAGSEYTVFTVDVDGRSLGAPWSVVTGVAVDGTDLPSAADITACAAPGCFHFDATTKHLEARVFGGASPRSITVR